jgi:hypothetical protein
MKSNKRHVYGLIITLFVLGLGLFFYRHLVLDVPVTDTETVNSWMVEANLRFTAERNIPVKANFIIPYMPPNFAIIDEYFVSYNYGVTTNLSSYNRQTVWSLRRANGAQSLYYRAIFRETDSNELNLIKPPMVKVQTLEDNQKSAVDTITNLARQSSADIHTFAQGTIKELLKKDGSAKLLIGSDFSDSNIIKAAIMILNQAKIFAMPVKGIYLNQQNKADFQSLLVVYNGKEWIYINPKTGSSGLPKNFLVWQYGSDPFYNVIGGGKKPVFNLSVSPTPINALTIAKARGLQTDSQMLRFSLLQLPVNVQETYKVLLTVPIGAFIILLLRNFIGLKTFGTFMPVLIALAFRETHVVWGISLFIIIVSLGLLARFYLDQLRLLLVPRLAAILTIVIILMIFISVVSQNLGLESGLSVALFPMVILTMTIERMCITWDERGASEAIKSGAGSLIAAVIAFWAMSWTAMQYLIFAFPELLLILLALILWFGQYRGYRLFELLRFKVLAGSK